MPKSYKDGEIIKIDFRTNIVRYGILNPGMTSTIVYEKPTMWESITGMAYRAASFWTPIVMCVAVYCAAMYGLIWAVEYASR